MIFVGHIKAVSLCQRRIYLTDYTVLLSRLIVQYFPPLNVYTGTSTSRNFKVFAF